MWHVNDGMGWWMVLGVIFMVVFWGAIVTFGIWGSKKLFWSGESQQGSTDKSNPLDVAKERYANGEISREEFVQLKKDLS